MRTFSGLLAGLGIGLALGPLIVQVQPEGITMIKGVGLGVVVLGGVLLVLTAIETTRPRRA